MTTREFDAVASNTRGAAAPLDPSQRRVVRIAWLIARLVHRSSVRFGLYEERFDCSLRSFHRDLATIRDAGIYLDNDRQGEYRLLCFRPEREAA